VIEPTCTQKQQNKRGGGKVAWAPALLKVDDGAHLHPQATKCREKKERKRGSLIFYRDLAMAPTCSQNQQNKKKKKGSWPLSKVGNGAHQNQDQDRKNKQNKKIGCLTLSSCFQTLCSSSSNFSALQALSSLIYYDMG
jgi:hypothetical protein